MATTVKELKATARPSVGKGAARAERRAGRVPGVIYGNNQPPLPISVDDRELRQRILAGRFLTTLYDIELEGKKHRVIPRDFHLDPIRDFPLHVDFMRLGEGATIRISVPLHVQKAEASPGVKRGGTVNIVTHTIEIECSVDNIPQYIEVDVGRAGDRPLAASRRRRRCRPASSRCAGSDAGHHRAAVGLRRRAEGGCGCCGRCGGSLAAGVTAPAAGAAAPAPGRLLLRLALRPRPVLRLPRPVRRRPLPVAATRRSKLLTRDAASCCSLSASAIPVRNTRVTGTISASWPSTKLRGVMVSHHGAAAFRARPRRARSSASA